MIKIEHQKEATGKAGWLGTYARIGEEMSDSFILTEVGRSHQKPTEPAKPCGIE